MTLKEGTKVRIKEDICYVAADIKDIAGNLVPANHVRLYIHRYVKQGEVLTLVNEHESLWENGTTREKYLPIENLPNWMEVIERC